MTESVIMRKIINKQSQYLGCWYVFNKEGDFVTTIRNMNIAVYKVKDLAV